MLYAPDEFDSSVIETFSVLFAADVHRSCRWSRGSDNPDHIDSVHKLLASKTISDRGMLVIGSGDFNSEGEHPSSSPCTH